MSESEAAVYIVDDDPAVRDSLQWLVESVNLPVKSYATGMDFLDSNISDRSGCVILDVRMPGMSGIEVFEELKTRKINIPTIFLTGHGDVHLAVRAMKAGACDFVEKPFNDQLLLDLIQKAIRQNAEDISLRNELNDIEYRLNNLTSREREVLDGVVAGNANRIIAQNLTLSEKTIEFHRAKMMEKMQADTLAELIRMVTTLGKLT